MYFEHHWWKGRPDGETHTRNNVYTPNMPHTMQIVCRTTVLGPDSTPPYTYTLLILRYTAKCTYVSARRMA